MEVLLYRWSTMAQLVSDTMIMIFLIVLYRSVRRPDVDAAIASADAAMYQQKKDKYLKSA